MCKLSTQCTRPILCDYESNNLVVHSWRSWKPVTIHRNLLLQSVILHITDFTIKTIIYIIYSSTCSVEPQTLQQSSLKAAFAPTPTSVATKLTPT
ncbi:hypothetical protein CBS147482_10811 [Aspergillus niger]|nr:hypothetical protein CBS147482_10811 [Aspergillus niger]